MTALWLAALASSAWLAAVDVANTTIDLRGEWCDMRSPGVLAELALANPRTAQAAGEHCALTAQDEQVCGALFEKALRGNPLLSGASLGLALLAERRGDANGAARIYADLHARDHRFAARWAEWNFLLRQKRMESFQTLTKEILDTAPPSFTGDFALQLEAGIKPEEVTNQFLNSGAQKRLLNYLVFLTNRNHPATGSLLVRALSESRDRNLRTAALTFISQRIRDRSGFGEAARVWEAALQHSFLPDRWLAAGNSAILNPNPKLKMPFLPRSFDWSAVGNAHASTRPNPSGSGVRIVVSENSPDGMPLLSKLLFFDGYPGGLTKPRTLGVYLDLAAECQPAETAGARAVLVWQLMDATSGKALDTYPLGAGEAARRASVSYTSLKLPPESDAVYLLLRYRKPTLSCSRTTEIVALNAWLEAEQ